MAETPIYTLKGASLSFGTNQLFRNVDLYINRGDKISLVGRNGSGKSTLLKVIAGIIEADNAEIFIQPGVRISYMPQEPDFSGFYSLKDVVKAGIYSSDENTDYKVDIMIEQFGILADISPDKASGGERRKAALARALVSEPDILLLDEPTNHLDMPTIEKLEAVISGFRGAVILISHDRMFLSNVSQTTFWLDRGILRRNNRGFKHFEEWQEQVIEQEIIEQKYLNKKIEEETEWLHKGVTARRRRNMGRLRRLQQLRQERREQIKRIGSVDLEISEGDFRSKFVLEAKHINKSFSGRDIVKDFSIRILKGNKIGVVGPNGAGKTTLIKLLTKRLEPDSGTVRLGKNLEEAYFDQNRITLDSKKTLWQTLCDKGDHIWVRGQYRHVVAYLKDFLFRPDQAQCPVSALSGGEKNRLMLAIALAQPSNFLVLDEPTNDLDMDTLDLLQEVLDEYSGTVLLVSHDRDFIDRVVTSVIYMSGNGNIYEHAGSYSDLLAKLAEKEENIVVKKKVKTVVEKVVRTSSHKSPRLSYNQQRQLEILPSEIEKIEQDISQTENLLSNPDLYNENPSEFNRLSALLSELQRQKDTKETTWLELQMLQDSIL
ncbi:MAG: ABC-F family ATP-binding cassette domain-containing protein [Alphaproteobacteria bacterium]|nr:ABC-F family ATP-binding cassette domain-containing protein [Alphaproteobacteria bacterium]